MFLLAWFLGFTQKESHTLYFTSTYCICMFHNINLHSLRKQLQMQCGTEGLSSLPMTVTFFISSDKLLPLKVAHIYLINTTTYIKQFQKSNPSSRNLLAKGQYDTQLFALYNLVEVLFSKVIYLCFLGLPQKSMENCVAMAVFLAPLFRLEV